MSLRELVDHALEPAWRPSVDTELGVVACRILAGASWPFSVRLLACHGDRIAGVNIPEGITPAPASGIELLLIRKAAKLTQREIAERLGTSRRYVGLLESAWRPSRAAIARYVAAVEAAAAELEP